MNNSNKIPRFFSAGGSWRNFSIKIKTTKKTVPAKKICAANKRKRRTANMVHGEKSGKGITNNPVKQITTAKAPIKTEVRGENRTTRNNTRPSPTHKPAQPIINCLKVVSRGPLKFKRTRNHNEGKVNAATANRIIIGFLSLRDPLGGQARIQGEIEARLNKEKTLLSLGK